MPEDPKPDKSEEIVSKIELSELNDDVQPEPQPEPKPEPKPEVTPEPDPKADPDPSKASIDDLFGPTPEPEKKDEVTTPEGEEPEGGDLPKVLRAEIANRKKEVETLREEKERLKAEYDERFDRMKKEREDIQKELSLQDPAHDPEVQAISHEFDAVLSATARKIGDPGPARRFMENAKELISQYAEIGDVTSEGYDVRYSKFRGQIDKLFGESANTVMNQMPDLDQMRGKLQNAVQAANGNSTESSRTRAVQAHVQSNKAFNEVIKKTLVFNEEMAQADPFSTQNVIAKMREKSESFAKISDEVVKFVGQAVVPPKPLDQEQLSGLTNEQRSELEGTVMQQAQKAQGELYTIVPLAIHAYHALPSLARELAEARRKLADIAGSIPPGGGKEVDPEPERKTDDKDLLPSGVRPISLGELSG